MDILSTAVLEPAPSFYMGTRCQSGNARLHTSLIIPWANPAYCALERFILSRRDELPGWMDPPPPDSGRLQSKDRTLNRFRADGAPRSGSLAE